MSLNKRREDRYLLATEAVVERKTGERIAASTINVSGSGVLLAIRQPTLNVGEQVRCGIRLYKGKAPQSWGIGTVIRVDGAQVAIDFLPPDLENGPDPA